MAVAVSAEALPGGPAPKAGVTVTGLGVGDSVVTVWRTVDDERGPVRGARRVVMNDAGFVTDWDAPINRPVSYEVEVLSGPGGPARASAEAITVVSATGWLMDPFVPQNAVPVVGGRDSNGEPYLRGQALAELEHQADMSMYNVMGSKMPIGLFGERMAERGMDLSLATRSAVESKRLKDLLDSSSGFLFRPGPDLDGLMLDALMFIGLPSYAQVPVDTAWGGDLTWWTLKADRVAAPTIKVLTATFTYGDVQLLTASYQQKQDAMAGKTYLDDLKNPLS
ncbi:hypothetical protein [Paenarthrobacter ureafaciens]|uniref:hypothetical protein n=1 Tax=Paenarthrobacter ureafaciens TaxID=37931 RepID=UPI001407F120|nr:hypothetical protein [Paenarthrobacter ureafaciens]MCX8455361.1 hypothetical protein [Paenarthrobacter ureafaciens]MCY0974088.1 hypothetical protein [Paenarthrobacter ureafaciens]